MYWTGDASEPLSPNTFLSYAKDDRTRFVVNGVSICVYQADICKLEVDCIVNAANDRLKHGGGVAHAIALAAGETFIKDGDRIVEERGSVKVGEAVATTAGNLKYKCVIHCVGPAWSDYQGRTREENCSRDLHEAVCNSLQLAEVQGCTSIALPAISSGT